MNNVAPLGAPTSRWLTTAHEVALVSDALDTVVPGRIVRLQPNDQIVVKIGVRGRSGTKPGEEVKVTVELVPEHKNSSSALLSGRTTWTLPVGIPDWRNEDSSLKTHEPPDWVS